MSPSNKEPFVLGIGLISIFFVVLTSAGFLPCVSAQETEVKIEEIKPAAPFQSKEGVEFPEEFLELDGLSPKFLKEHMVLPLRIEDNKLEIAMADPLDKYSIDNIRLSTGKDVKVTVSSQRDILRALEDRYGDATMDEIIEDIAEEDLELLGSEEDEDIDHLRDRAFEAPVIRLVNLLISRAVEAGASDIHIEPFEGQLKIRYRSDGVLHDVESPPRALESAIVSRV